MPLCFSQKLKCIENITVNKDQCIPNCQGIVITSYEKNEEDRNIKDFLSTFSFEYDLYKRKMPFPIPVKGKMGQ